MAILEHRNRLDYGEALMPDDGWKTSWAIGTTYSLELDTLLAIPLALFQAKYLTESTDLRNLRTDMLHALKQVKDKVFIFTQADNLRIGTGIEHIDDKKLLYSFLDQNIFNIQTEPHQNFHPKVWLIRYETINPAETHKFSYRLIVSSRNITAATDFDLAVTMKCDYLDEGSTSKENENLRLMMTQLMEKAKEAKAEKEEKSGDCFQRVIKDMREELKKIRFKAPDNFDQKDPVFLPSGFKSKAISHCPLADYTSDQFKNSLIISPFLDEVSLDRFAQANEAPEERKPILISRQNEMDKISPSTLEKYDCWKWSDVLENAADYEENESLEENWSRSISLHAKLVILHGRLRGDRTDWNYWFVGSANFTNAGFGRNYEAMIRLKGNKDSATSPEDILKTLSDSKCPLILPYSSIGTEKETADKTEEDIREIKRQLSLLEIKAEKSGTNANGNDILKLSTNSIDWRKFTERAQKLVPDIKISAHLMTRTREVWNLLSEDSLTIRDLSITDYTPFLYISISWKAGQVKKEEKFLKIIPITIPADRADKVLLKILDNEEKFVNYIMFCFDENTDPGLQRLAPGKGKTPKSKALSPKYSDMLVKVPILEKLMLAKSRSPQAVDEIKGLIELMEKEEKQGHELMNRKLMDLLKTMIG